MKLYDFQIDYLEGLPPKFIFAAETGTGKSLMALEHYKRHAYPKKLLILGPAAKMRTEEWQREVERYFGDYAPEAHYFSYEKFSRNPTVKEYKKTGSRGVWRDWLRDNPPGSFALVADEAHRCANAQSGIGKAVFAVAQAAASFSGLSATPLPNGWISAQNYFKVFGFTKNLTEFKKRYCNIQTFKGFPEIVGYYYEDELKRLWNRIAKPLKKEDAIDLPERTDVDVRLPAGTDYARVRKELAFDGRILDNPSAMIHALRQSTQANKLPWLDEFLEGTGSNVIVFYNYVSERKAILEMLAKKHPGRRVFRIDGDLHDMPHRGDWDGLERTVTLAQYQSGSTGIELQYADVIVFYAPTWSYVLYQQAIGRIERIGQRNRMTTYNLECPATIENDVWRAVRRKADFSEKAWAAENLTDEEKKRIAKA